MVHPRMVPQHRKRQTLVVNGSTFFQADSNADIARTSIAAARSSAAAAIAATATTTRTTTVAPVTTTSAAAVATTTTVAAKTTTAVTTSAAAVVTTTTTSRTASTRPNWRSATTDESSSAAAAASSGTSKHSSSSTSAGAKSTAVSDASSSSSSSGHGGAIGGAIVAVVVVLAAVAGFFLWKKKKAARAARASGNTLMGDSSPGGNAAMYSKRHETADSNLFADSSASPNSWHDGEKFGTAAAVGAGAGGAYGAVSQGRDNDPWSVQQQQLQQQAPQLEQRPHDSWAAPSFGSTNAPQSQYGQQQAYPPQNVPGSTANLLSGGSSAPLALGAAIPTSAPSSSPFADPSHQSIEQREMQQEQDNRRLSLAAKAAGAAGVAGLGAGGVAASSPFGESEGQGEIRIVKGTFDPSLEDELVLYPGDRIQVLMKYDDGWALGINLDHGGKGVFPHDCLGDLAPSGSSAAAAAPSSNNNNPTSPAPSFGLVSPNPSNALPAALLSGAPARQSVLFGQQQQAKLTPQPLDTKSANLAVNPANVPLPPPTPTGHSLSPFAENFSANGITSPSPSSMSINTSSPPQLAPLTLGSGSDSPLSASFPSRAATPTATQEGLTAPPTPVKQNKRHSSLIASRDADLFVALGEVLGDEQKQ